eukprot:6184484-Pleurochrysis_carterae.AAC.1
MRGRGAFTLRRAKTDKIARTALRVGWRGRCAYAEREWHGPSPPTLQYANARTCGALVVHVPPQGRLITCLMRVSRDATDMECICVDARRAGSGGVWLAQLPARDADRLSPDAQPLGLHASKECACTYADFAPCRSSRESRCHSRVTLGAGFGCQRGVNATVVVQPQGRFRGGGGGCGGCRGCGGGHGGRGADGGVKDVGGDVGYDVGCDARCGSSRDDGASLAARPPLGVRTWASRRVRRECSCMQRGCAMHRLVWHGPNRRGGTEEESAQCSAASQRAATLHSTLSQLNRQTPIYAVPHTPMYR